MAKHTPGPWALMDRGDYGDFDGRSQVIMSEPLSGDNPFRIAAVHVSDEEGAANAVLLVSAPQLLEALVDMTPPMPAADARCHNGITPQADCRNCQRIARAHAAIAQATGSTS